jgi:hypothetical protein
MKNMYFFTSDTVISQSVLQYVLQPLLVTFVSFRNIILLISHKVFVYIINFLIYIMFL